MRDVFGDMQQEFCYEEKNGVNFWRIVLHITSDYRTTYGNTDANPIPNTIFNTCPQAEKNSGMPMKRSIDFDEIRVLIVPAFLTSIPLQCPYINILAYSLHRAHVSNA
jgi:hypothetical protein